MSDYRNSSSEYKHLTNVLTSVLLNQQRDLSLQSLGNKFLDPPRFQPDHAITAPRE
jgi:hypothetical protein